MKKSVLKIIGMALGLSTALSSVFLFTKTEQKADAIGNNTTSASTYYNSITATSGKQLAAQLHDLITRTHTYYTSYDDNGKNKYQQQTDQYYENNSKVSGYIYEFYSGVKWPNGWYPTSGNTSGGYNREHCWCQSNSVNENGTQMWGESGGGADMHHLRPVEVRLNSTRNNHPYGELSVDRDEKKVYAKLGTNETYAHGGYYYNDVFEPLDSKKGDVARIILYTYLHYNSYTISSIFGSHGTTNGSSNYSSYFSSSLLSLTKTTNQNTEAKALELLLKWNTNDPVDDIERRRNEQVAVYQGNRNPFIDNSSYADAIWGTTAGITSISKTTANLTVGATTTISAISSTGGNISWSTSDSNVCSISSGTASSGSTITLTGGSAGSATITASITISGTTYSKTCTVTVSNPKTLSSIAVSDAKTEYTVNEAFVRPTVTATYSDSSTADVSISATFSEVDLSTTGTKTVNVSYTEGETTKSTSYDITVSEAASTSSETFDITAQGYSNAQVIASIEGANFSATLADGGGTEPAYYTTGTALRAYAKNVLTFSSEQTIVRIVFTFGSSDGSNDISVSTGSYSNGTWTGSANSVVFTIGGTNGNRRIRSITVTYESSGGTEEVTFDSITLDTTYVQTSFVLGETFNYDGLIVEAHYSDGTSEDLDSFDIVAPDMTSTGQKTVSVSHTEGEITKTASYTITVSEVSGGTLNNPYSVSEARSAIDNAGGSTISNKYILGYIYYIKSYSSTYKSITYWISDTGLGNSGNYDGVQVFGGKGINGADFSGQSDLSVGDKVLVYGSLTLYNNTTYEVSSNSSIISLTRMSSLSVSGQTTSYDVGDTFSFDGTATLTYSDSTNKNVTTSVSCSAPNMSTSGTKTITVSYTEFGGTISTTYQITVNGPGGDITTNSQRVVSNSSSEHYEEGSLVLSLSNNAATASCDAFTITQTKVSGSTAVTLIYDEIRVYSGHSLAITPSSGYVITSIELSTGSADYASAIGGSSLTNCTKTVSSNLVTLTPADGSSAVSFLNSAQSRIRYVIVNFEELIVQTYTLVTDPTTLGTGDEVIFVGNKNDSSYYQNKTVEANGTGYYLKTAQGEAPSNNVIKLTDSTSPLLLEKSNGLFRFKQADGTYLAAYNNSSSNYLGYESAQSLTDKSLFSLSINNSNGKVTSLMSQTTALTHKYILFNGSNYWFGCYTTNSNSYSYHIFKKTSQVDADTWSSTFLLTTENCTMTVNQWNQLGTSYGSLSNSAKEEILNCIANASTDYSKRSQAMARYEYILSDARFNTGLSNFIAGRNVSEARGNITALLSLKNSQSLIIIVIISTISVSAIGGYFFLKSRRKENF